MTDMASGRTGGVRLSVVMPVYNEQDILEATVTAIVDGLRRDPAVTSFELIVSENGSTDGTRALARELAARYEEVAVLESDVADYGAAMRAGFRAASGAFIVNFDADYYDLQFVGHALAADADVVIAAKGIAGSHDSRAVLRRVASRAFGLLVRRLLGLRTTETHGIKLFRRAAIQPLIPQVHATKDLFDTELVARAEHAGLAIVELPIATTEMRHPRSAILTRVPRTVWGLARMRQRLRAHPAQPAGAHAPAQTGGALSGLHDGDVIVGRRLFVVRHGGVAVDGAEESLVAFDEAGDAVVVVVVASATTGTGCQLADELDRLAQLTPAQLGGSAHTRAAQQTALPDAHAAFFQIDAGSRPQLNGAQRAVLLVRDPPEADVWLELLVELGGQLAGVYRIDGETVVALEVPEELRANQRPRRLGHATLVVSLLVLVATAMVLGVGVRDLWVTPSDPAAGSVVRDVATGVPATATHNQWIGQDHVVRTSQGQLLAVYPSEHGLALVSDHADHGRAWRPPTMITDLPATSSSVAIDDADRLHVAFSDGARVSYTLVQRRAGQWTSSAVLHIDAETRTPYLDIAYDPAADVAHVVWVGETPEGQTPRWAAISGANGHPRVAQTGRLAPPATDIPVLVNIAAGPRSQVVATYRRGDAALGWSARTLGRQPDGTFAWDEQETVPTEAVIGAAALVIDHTGVTHLVLRDSTSFGLTYLTRSPQGQWSQPEAAVDAESIEEIDHPSLTVDRSSRLVYLFFQSDRGRPQPGVQVAVRHPTLGWEAPQPAASADDLPHGARQPTSISTTAGAPIVVWTTGATSPVMQAAVITP